MSIKTLKQHSDEVRKAALSAIAGRGDVEQAFIEAARLHISATSAQEPEWLTRARLNALETFERLGFPHKRIEEWKYTDLRQAISDMSLSPKTEIGKSAVSETELLDIRPPHGIEVMHAINRNADQLDWLKNKIEKLTPSEDNPMAVLSFAMAPAIAVLRIPEGEKLEGYFLDLAAPDTEIMQEFLFIEIEPNASLTLLESGGAPDKMNRFRNLTTHIHVGENGSFTHYTADGGTDELIDIRTRMINLDAHANYKAVFANFGGKLARNEIRLRCNGEHANADLYGAYLMAGSNHFDTTTILKHAVPHCVSNQSFKGVLTDKATGVFQGKVTVEQDAQHTDAKQMSKALLLSDHCEMDAKPELVIYADDVKCAHGATSGDLDEDSIFYLRARGIPEADARRLLIEAYLQEIFDHIEDEEMASGLSEALQNWLEMHLSNNLKTNMKEGQAK